MNQAEALAYLGFKEMPEDQEIIKKAYRSLAKKVHPDSGGNDALFRLVNEAYECLTNHPETTVSRQTGKTPETQNDKQQKVRWTDIISKPDFVIPFKTLYYTLSKGQTSRVLYKQHDVHISFSDAIRYPIKTNMTLTVHVSSWPTRLHKLLGVKPKTNQKTISVGNNALCHKDRMQSYIFQHRLGIAVNRGYHIVQISMPTEPGLNTKTACSTWFRHSRMFTKEYIFSGIRPITLRITMRIHN